MKLQKRGHADWFGADDSPSGTTSSRMPTGEAKKAIAPTAPRTGSLAPRATQTLHPCLASVCPSTDDPITDIRGRDGTPFTRGAPVSRRATCRKLTSQGRQIREKPVTALTLCSQPLELESSQRTSAATRSNSWSIKHASLRKVNGHTPNERQQIETRIRAHGHWGATSDPVPLESSIATGEKGAGT
jgi:hypothetical protein